MARRWFLWLVGAIIGVVGAPAQAGGFALDTFEPAPAGDTFLSVPDAFATDHRAPTLAVLPAFADHPYGLFQDGVLVPNGWVVRNRLTLHAGAALALGDAWVVDVALPLVVSQRGEAPLSGMEVVAPGVLGDLRLGARWAFQSDRRLTLALAAMLFLPTGDRGAYASDGAVRILPQLLASGEGAGLRWSGNVGYHARQVVEAGATQAGAAVTGGGAVALRFADGAFQVGPELTGRLAVSGTSSRTLEGLVGVRWRPGPLAVGLGLGGRLLERAPGAAGFRAILRLEWTPEAAAR